MQTEAEITFTAGFFAGEGTVHVGDTGGVYRLQLVFTNTDLMDLQWVRARWGGQLYKSKRGATSIRWTKQCYFLRFNNFNEAVHLMKAIFPFLVGKAELMGNALEFCEVKAKARAFSQTPLTYRRELERLAQRHRDLRAHVPVEEPPAESELEEMEQTTLPMSS